MAEWEKKLLKWFIFGVLVLLLIILTHGIVNHKGGISEAAFDEIYTFIPENMPTIKCVYLVKADRGLCMKKGTHTTNN